MQRNFSLPATLALLLLVSVSCLPEDRRSGRELIPEPEATYGASPMWAKSANLYEVNVRQYTPEGTFRAFAEHLPRLDDMGVDILWFMPIYPISETKRKGELGSYYAVSDYTATNPEFGSVADFQAVVDEAHRLGMKVILDWVPNHTGWDHVWLEAHPEWFTQDSAGNVIDPVNYETGESWGWTDVADLNYDNDEMRLAMIAELRWWLDSVNIDGYRMDVAHGVPYDFWAQCSDSLRKTRADIFLLAEAEDDTLLNEQWFAMDYAWSFHHLLNDLVVGESSLPADEQDVAPGAVTANDLMAWYEQDQQDLRHGYHMHFITNHDENAWAGTVRERMGDAADALAVLAFTFDGMPLIYSGQEAGMNKRLEFFEKDTIEWGEVSKQTFYTRLLSLKHDHKALWNGRMGGPVQRLKTNHDESVLAFVREKSGDNVIVVLNLSDEPVSVLVPTVRLEGKYEDAFTGETVVVGANLEREMQPWAYLVIGKEG